MTETLATVASEGLLSGKYLRGSIATLLLVSMAGCSQLSSKPALPKPDYVQLERFMGPWHVLGFIPLFPERNAYNGIERYQLNEKGEIETIYRFRKGGFDGPLKTYRPKATVVEGSANTHWKMQFIWPFKADYKIAYVDKDYSVAIIARDQRDYVWLLSRSPELPEARFDALTQRIAAMGYKLDDFKRQPQRWPEAEARPELDK